jgi:hypothetical protein
MKFRIRCTRNLQDDPIDDDVEIVRPRTIEHQLIPQVDDLPVDPRAHETLAAQAIELELQLAFARPNDGGEQRETRPFAHLEDVIDDLLHGLRFDALSAFRAMRNPDPREQQPQVIGDFRDRADRRTRSLGERALLDRDRRREPFDGVDVGLGQLFEELSRVGGQRLDVPPLTLGVDGVECERRFP